MADEKNFLLQFFRVPELHFFTPGFALILAKFSFSELQYVFLIASFLLSLVGFIYPKIEHLFNIGKFSILSPYL